LWSEAGKIYRKVRLARLPRKLEALAGLINLAFVFDALAGSHLRTMSMYSRARFSGRSKTPPCQPAMLLFATPRPSSKRPPERSCKVADWIPKVTGLRP